MSLRWNNCLPITPPQQDDQEEEISWADAMEDLERQKQTDSGPGQSPERSAAPESSAL